MLVEKVGISIGLKENVIVTEKGVKLINMKEEVQKVAEEYLTENEKIVEMNYR